jgi:pantetheine-phosphate adenylyltransferase
MKVLYPGSFDPITLGHIDLIKRASKLFSQVFVGVVIRTSKDDTLFTYKQRFELVKKSLKGFKNVKVEGFDGLVVEYAKKKNIKIILRGLRMISDFEYEFQMALTNRKLNQDIETIFLMPHPDFSFVSSRLIKEAFFLGADISCFVPQLALQALNKKKNEGRR